MRAVVIGAGAVGLAVARALAERGDEVFVLEAASHPGGGTTSRNSEVLHAGIYYPPGSLKARLCREGRDLLADYLIRHHAGLRRCGKLIVAVERDELGALSALADNARACGVDDLELLEASEVSRRHPAVRCVRALWSPSTGILSAWDLVRALRSDLERAGGLLVLDTAVRGAEAMQSGYRLTVEIGGVAETFECDVVVNCAGLNADLVARMPLEGALADLPAHRFVRGSYVRLWWPAGATVAPPDCLVYPMPEESGTGLGIHLTADLAGGLRLGPDTEPLGERREDYTVTDAIVPRFEAAARRYLALPDGVDLTPDFAGIRPVRDDRSGSRDFYIEEESRRGLPGWVNLLGIESPGLTSSLAIGRYVASLV